MNRIEQSIAQLLALSFAMGTKPGGTPRRKHKRKGRGIVSDRLRPRKRLLPFAWLRAPGTIYLHSSRTVR